MICINVWKKEPCNYISLEHLEHAANHHDGSVRHPFHVGGRQIPQFVSQKPQINHCLWRLRHLQLTHKFVYIFSNVSHEVLGAKNIYEGPAITKVTKHIIFGSLLETMLLCRGCTWVFILSLFRVGIMFFRISLILWGMLSDM